MVVAVMIRSTDSNDDDIVIIDKHNKAYESAIAFKKTQCMKIEHVLKLVFHSINWK